MNRNFVSGKGERYLQCKSRVSGKKKKACIPVMAFQLFNGNSKKWSLKVTLGQQGCGVWAVFCRPNGTSVLSKKAFVDYPWNKGQISKCRTWGLSSPSSSSLFLSSSPASPLGSSPSFRLSSHVVCFCLHHFSSPLSSSSVLFCVCVWGGVTFPSPQSQQGQGFVGTQFNVVLFIFGKLEALKPAWTGPCPDYLL